MGQKEMHTVIPEQIIPAGKLPEQLTENSFPTYMSALVETLRLLQETEGDKLPQLSQMIYDTYLQGKRVFFMGNGGSAGVASHAAADITKRPLPEPRSTERPTLGFNGVSAIALTDNGETLTMVGNDWGYDHSFSHQLHSQRVGEGDTVIAISGSGTSANIIEGVNIARKRGAKTIGISGFGGGQLAEITDLSIVISDEPGNQLATINNGATMAIFEGVADQILHASHETIRANLEITAQALYQA